MSILSGYKKFKRYVLTDSGYQLCSQWTSSNTVHFDDGKTAQAKVGAINGITDSLTATNSNIALSAKAGKNLQDQVTALPRYSAGNQLTLSDDTFKLSDTCTIIDDWNHAISNGFFMAYSAPNAPFANVWFYGIVIAHNESWIRQILYRFGMDVDDITNGCCDRYERIRYVGTWGPWVNTSVRKAVPSDAVFTDTTYGVATQSANGLMAATDKRKLDGIPGDTQSQINKLNTDLTSKLDKTGGTIAGEDLNINGDDKGTRGLRIRRNASDHESAKLTVNDNGLLVESIQDEASANITFNLVFTDTEKNGGAGAGKQTVRFYADKNNNKLTIDTIEVKSIIGQNVQFSSPLKTAGVLLGGSDFAYVYGDGDDVWMRYKGNNGKAAYTSAKTLMDLIAAVNNVLEKATVTTITTVESTNTNGSLFADVPSYYVVKNNWCVFHIWIRYTGAISSWFPLHLPKTAMGNHVYFEDNYEHNGQMRIETNGRVRFSSSKASLTASHYWGCYPIA